MSQPLRLEFLAEADDVDRMPATRAEIVFVGRSNVGKSSLINAIADRKVLAPVSKNPGRTKTLRCFALDRGGATIVDCPGYGYSKAAKSIRATWLPMIERYLLGREQLVMVLLLVDGEIGPTTSDLEMLEWLRESGLPHVVVATKHDKVRPSKRVKRQREFAEKCRVPAAEVLWGSAIDGVGIGALRQRIREWLG